MAYVFKLRMIDEGIVSIGCAKAKKRALKAPFLKLGLKINSEAWWLPAATQSQ
jgi:hypothetical protein